RRRRYAGSTSSGTALLSSVSFVSFVFLPIEEPLKPRVVAQAIELGLDARTRRREGALLRERAFQKGERGLRIAAQRMDRRGIVARERIVGAQPHAAVEALERDVEHRLRLASLAEVQVRAAEPCVQLDEDPAAQRVIGAHQEVDLALEIRDRFGVASLERRQVAGSHVGTGDEQTLAAR